jgi:hypothetical protein
VLNLFEGDKGHYSGNICRFLRFLANFKEGMRGKSELSVYINLYYDLWIYGRRRRILIIYAQEKGPGYGDRR